MQPVGIGGTNRAASRPPRRGRGWLLALALVIVTVGTAAGFTVARDRALDEAERLAQDAADRSAGSLETRLQQLAAALTGASAIAGPDGSPGDEPGAEAFRSYAGDVLATGGIDSLMLVGVDGTTGEPRYPLLAVEPAVPGSVTIGMDMGAVPARSVALRQAARTGEPSITGVVDLRVAGEPGIEMFRPIIGRGEGAGTVRAFVAIEVPLEDLGATMRVALEPGMEVALLDGEEPILGPVFDRRTSTRTVTAAAVGETWTVAVGPVPAADLTLAWWIAAVGVVAIGALTALALASSGHRRRAAQASVLLERSEDRNLAVQEVAGRLARALSGGDIVTALVDHLPAAVGARSALIATVAENGKVELLGPDVSGSTDESRSFGADISDSVVGKVMEGGAPAWLSSPLAWRGDEITATFAGGGEALALLPLAADDVTGVLAVSYPRIRIFADDEQAFLETIGLLASRALARGRRYDTEHQVALAFQHAALPSDLPAVDGLTIAARYRPAMRQATIGGDWYDVLVLDQHRVVLVVGDVVGHGLVAAAAMGRLRTAFQAIVPLSTDPGAMLQALSHQVESIPDSFCTTVVCAVIDLRAGTMTWCRAGHPPPLVVGHRGIRLFDEACLPPLGVVPEMTPPVHTHDLAEGDLIVLYTDGMVERRGESIDQGFERLGIVADNLADLEPEEFSDTLVEALVPVEEQTDDLAVLVVRFDRRAPEREIQLGGSLTVGGPVGAPSGT